MKHLLSVVIFSLSLLAQSQSVKVITAANVSLYSPAETDSIVQAAVKSNNALLEKKITDAESRINLYADSLYKLSLSKIPSMQTAMSYTDSAYTRSLNYCDSAVKTIKNSLDLQLLNTQKPDTLVPGNGIRFDSLAPKKTLVTPQLFYDPVTRTIKQNY